MPPAEYYELLASAEVITLDDMECVRPDILFRLDNSEWWQNPVFAPWLGQFDIIIDSISWLAPAFDKKTWEYKPLFKESITRLLVSGGRFIGYDNPWFIETRITVATLLQAHPPGWAFECLGPNVQLELEPTGGGLIIQSER